MNQLNLGFGRYSDANLLVGAVQIHASLVGNVFYTTPIPSLAALQTAIDAYSEALAAAADGSKGNIAIKNARRLELIDLLVQEGIYVMLTANQDPEKLASTAFPPRKPRGALPPVTKAVILKLEDGQNSGDLLVVIAAVKGARAYVYQYTEDPLTESSEWISLGSTSIKALLTGLVPGKKYWIRVIVYGTNGQQVIGDADLSQIIR